MNSNQPDRKKNILLLRRARKIHKSAHALGVNLTAIMELSQLHDTDLTIYNRIVGVEKGASLEEWIAAAKYVASIQEIDCLGVFSEPAEYIGVEVAKALGLPYVDFETIDNTHNKISMRKALVEKSVDGTQSVKITKPFADNIKKFMAVVQGPIIIKPMDTRASTGVSCIRNESEISSAVDWLLKAGDVEAFIAEEFLEGDEFSVECFSEAGKHFHVAITQKSKEGAHFVETGHVTPAPISAEQSEQIFAHVEQVLDALGVASGPTHTEVILTPSGPRLVETHLRVGGDDIDNLVQMTTGVDLHELWVRQVLGESVKDDLLNIERSGTAGIRYLIPDEKGEVIKIKGLDDVRNTENVEKVSVLIEEGEKITDLVDSSARALSVMAQAASHSQLAEILDNAINHLEFEVR